MRNIFLFFLVSLVLFNQCTGGLERNSLENAETIEVSDYVVFDMTTQRYRFIGDLGETKSSSSYYYEYLSMTKENEILDSLEHIADSLGLSFRVNYSQRTKSDIDSLPVIDSLMIPDTCEIKYFSGELSKNEVVNSGIVLTPTGSFCAGAYCTLFVTGPINALFYSVYHNLIIRDTDSVLCVMTGTDGNFLSQGYYQGASSGLLISYTNSEFQEHKLWICAFQLQYQEYNYQGIII